MNYKEFIKSLGKDNLQTAYFFTGEEVYLMNEAIKALKIKYIEETMETLNYIVLDGKEISFDNILNACETLPFMSQKKIVIIKDIGGIIDSNQNNFEEKFASYLNELGDYISLVIMDRSSSLKKTGKFYRTIKKMNGVVEFPSLRGQDLNAWIYNKLKERDIDINQASLNYFIQQSTYSDYNSDKTLYDLENELNKLISYTSKKSITKEDIDLILTKSLDTNIFNLLNSINKKDSESALRIFNEMHIANEPVQRILFMIIRQVRLMLSYKLYRGKGYSDTEIQGKMQIKTYEFKKIASQAQGFTEGELAKALEYILERDIKQKTSSFDEKLALEMLIINLSILI